MSQIGKAAGFGLVEALITLLVLSVGLLGLGRLQAGLWRSSGDTNASADALLMAQNLLEIERVDWLPGPVTDLLPQPAGGPVAVDISRKDPAPAFPQLAATRLTLRWQRPSGAKSVHLTAVRNSEIRTRDTRWLLPIP